MTDTLFVSTRKGLFRLERAPRGAWFIAHVAFLGDSVSIAHVDRKTGTVTAGLGLGHFGVKMRRSVDRGGTWTELAAPAFPPMPEGTVSTLPDGRPWPWRVEQIWEIASTGDGTLFAGTIGGGLFRSRDGGASWSLCDGLWNHPLRKEWFGGGADMPGIHSVCVHPADPSRLVVGVSCGGVWHSTDGGDTWELGAEGMFAAYMPDARSKDPAIQDPHRVVRCASSPERLWSQHHNGVFRSDDGGRRWKAIDTVSPSVFGFAVAVHPHDGDVAWLVPAVKDETRVPVDAKLVVARTRDGGKTWTELRTGLPQEHAYDIVFRHALDVDATGKRLAFGTTTGSLFVTEDEGDSWTHVSAHLPPIYAVTFG
ncbi:MAG: hypothetical protein U0169_21970 [Polyangiaceae bacterium]